MAVQIQTPTAYIQGKRFMEIRCVHCTMRCGVVKLHNPEDAFSQYKQKLKFLLSHKRVAHPQHNRGIFSHAEFDAYVEMLRELARYSLGDNFSPTPSSVDVLNLITDNHDVKECR